jgi:cobalt/nickel transport system permease protein
MPEWLLKGEIYTPQSDKDTFINKSILSLLSVLSRIRAQNKYRTKKFEVSAILRVAFTFILIVFLSLSKSFTFVLIVNVYLISALSLMPAEEIIRVLKASLIFTAFTFIILMPSALWGNYYSIAIITPKVFATVMSVNILSRSTQWNNITGALKTFFIPDIFIFVLDITIKYIMLLGEFSLNMLYSLKLRSVGKNKNKYASVSGIAGTLFIKSKEMAEDMYSAMECRGFSGDYPINKNFRFTSVDFIYLLINAVIIVAFFIV